MSMANASASIESVQHSLEEDLKPRSLWAHAWKTLINDRIAFASLIIVGIYSLIALSSAMGLIAGSWDQ